MDHARFLAGHVYKDTVQAYQGKRPQVQHSFFPKNLPLAETEATASSEVPNCEDWIGLADIFFPHDVLKAVCLSALDEARIFYAQCLVMQSRRASASESEWKAPDSIGSFSRAADRLAAELRNLTNKHEEMPIEYKFFPIKDADEVLQQLHN